MFLLTTSDRDAKDSGICPSLRLSKIGMTEREKNVIPVSEARRIPESSPVDGSIGLRELALSR